MTAVPLTLLLLGEALAVPELRGILLRAKQRRLCTLDQVAACCARHRNVKGVEALRCLAWELEDSRADSVFEEAVRARLIERGLVPDAGQEPVPVPAGRTLHVDVPFRARLVGIECDGASSAGTVGCPNVRPVGDPRVSV